MALIFMEFSIEGMKQGYSLISKCCCGEKKVKGDAGTHSRWTVRAM